MAQSFLLQDWNTVQLAASDSIVQAESDWLDLGPYTDLFGYTTTKQATAGVSATLHLETSPSRDNDLFQAMASIALTPTSQFTTAVRYASASVPLARWVRWRISATAAATVNFRVWISANAQGGLIMSPPQARGIGRPMRPGRGFDEY